MISGIRIAVSSYSENTESTELATQIAFYLAKERKNKVYFIENKENSLIDQMRGRTEVNEVTFCKEEPDSDPGFNDDECVKLYIYDLGLASGPIPMSDKFDKIYMSIDNEKINIEMIAGKLASVTDGEQLITVLLQHSNKEALDKYREIVKKVIKIQEPDYSRCPFDVKQDLDNFSHKKFFSVPDPKKVYNFDKLPIQKEENTKKEKKSLFSKKNFVKEKDKDKKNSEEISVSQPSIPDYNEEENDNIQPDDSPEVENKFTGKEDIRDEKSEEVRENEVPEEPAISAAPTIPELKPSIYGEDEDDENEKSGIKDRILNIAGNIKNKADQAEEKRSKSKKTKENVSVSKEQREQRRRRQRTRREPDYAGKIQSLKDKSEFVNTLISIVNICLVVAIVVVGYNFFMGFRNNCHTPVQTKDIVITKEPTSNGISGIEIKNYSGVAKNKKVAVIIGEDTFIRPYTESIKELKKKTSVKAKRYAITVNYTDDPMIQSMFGELTFVHYSVLGETKFSNDDYDEIIEYAKKYYTKKKYDFFKYKDKDSIQPGTPPISMIQDLEGND